MSRDVLLELKKTLLFLLVPAPCLACGTIDRELERPLGLCLRCRGRLVRVRDPCCPGCARPLAAGVLSASFPAAPPAGRPLRRPTGEPSAPPAGGPPARFRCGRCRLQPPVWDRLVAHWVYQPPLDRVVRGLKFSRLRFLGEQLGRALADRVARDPPPVDLVVPVPLHWRRRLERGYNQADEIARALAGELALPHLDALARRRATRAQTDLPRGDRRANLRAAFRCRARGGVRGRRILLVDDVVTTGATLSEAARCLVAAGSGPIFAAVVARTPEPGEVREGEIATLHGQPAQPIGRKEPS